MILKDDFDLLVKKSMKISKEKGWVKGNDAEAMMLMVCEIAEACEWNRAGNPPSDHIPGFSGEEEEFADLIIRIMGYAGHRNLDIAGALLAKLTFNTTREQKHGGKKY